MAMLEVWGRRNSFNVQKVLWLVGELGLPHRHIPAGGSHGGLDDPAFRRMNPHGRVPVIRDGDLVVWDNTGTMHRVRPYDLSAGRLLHRTTVLGDEPFDSARQLEKG